VAAKVSVLETQLEKETSVDNPKLKRWIDCLYGFYELGEGRVPVLFSTKPYSQHLEN